MTSNEQNNLAALLSHLASSPRFYLHRINRLAERAYVVEVDREFFQRANFLDERALSQEVKGRWVPLEALRRSVFMEHPLPLGVCHFIFHVGHCGSTLISRLLELLPTVLAFREPLPVRGLADAYPRADKPYSLFSPEQVVADLKLVYQMLARRFSPEVIPIVKTTSNCGCLGPQLLSFNDHNKALLLSMGLEPYLANMLSNHGHISAARRRAPIRMRTLLRHVDAHELRLYQLSHGQLVALGWLAEIVNLNAIHSRFGAARAMRLDFDKFLDQPALNMARICEHFLLPSDDSTISNLLNSKEFSSYSKYPDQPFGSQDRLERLQNSRKQNGAEITAGMDFASELAGRFGLIAEAVEAFEPGKTTYGARAAQAN